MLTEQTEQLISIFVGCTAMGDARHEKTSQTPCNSRVLERMSALCGQVLWQVISSEPLALNTSLGLVGSARPDRRAQAGTFTFGLPMADGMLQNAGESNLGIPSNLRSCLKLCAASLTAAHTVNRTANCQLSSGISSLLAAFSSFEDPVRWHTFAHVGKWWYMFLGAMIG